MECQPDYGCVSTAIGGGDSGQGSGSEDTTNECVNVDCGETSHCESGGVCVPNEYAEGEGPTSEGGDSTTDTTTETTSSDTTQDTTTDTSSTESNTETTDTTSSDTTNTASETSP